MEAYAQALRSRRDPVAGMLTRVFDRLKRTPKRVVFAEGEEEQVIRAAAAFVEQGLGTVLLVGRENRVRETAENAGIDLDEGMAARYPFPEHPLNGGWPPVRRLDGTVIRP